MGNKMEAKDLCMITLLAGSIYTFNTGLKLSNVNGVLEGAMYVSYGIGLVSVLHIFMNT